MTTTKIKILRHGQPEGEGCFRGHTDFLLTELGFEQMISATSQLNDIEVVVSSPLIRCAKFARYFSRNKAVTYSEDKIWKELDFGDWDGREKSEIWEHEQSLLTKFWSEPWNVTPPNGESLDCYDQRINLAWHSILEEHKGKNILLVTHGGVIKQLIRQILEIPKSEVYLQRMAIPYAALINISVYCDDEGRLWPQIEWPQLF